MEGKRYVKNKRHIPSIFIVIIIVAIISVCFLTFSKYVAEQQEKKLAETREFIFNSNYKEGKIYNVYDSELIITLSNYELDFVNKSDIEYTVTVKDDEDNNISYIDSGEGVIIGGTKNIEEINVTGIEKNKKYYVEINSVKPYAKTLKMQFYVVEEIPTENYYRVTKNDSWIQLEVYIGSNVPSEGIIIDYTGLSPDNTNEIMRNWMSTEGENKGVFADITEYSKYTFIFFGESNSVSKTKIEGNLINL